MTARAGEVPGRVDRRLEADRFRRAHPVMRVGAPVWEQTERGGGWTWSAAFEAGPTFTSRVEIDCGEPTGARPPQAVGQVLALVDALSYWKAAVPPRLVVEGPVPGTAAWWDAFVARAMAEHLWRNGLDPAWAPHIEADWTEKPLDAPDRVVSADATLVLHSGGKDSMCAAHLARRAGRSVRPVCYQPTPAMRAVVASAAPPGGWSGPPVTVLRRLDPLILDLNAAGYLNGHTPYSAWLAVAATAAAELCGIARVAAGNSRSDDEPNIVGRLGTGAPWPVNHQWTKSAEFEEAWTAVAGPERRYASPLRPLFELGVLAGLAADPLPGWSSALSCNRAAKAGRDGTWCGRCPKCLWTAAALEAVAGPGAGRARLGVDALADPANGPELAAMCGRSGPVPFECAGTPAEVRSVLRTLHRRAEVPAAVAAVDPAAFEAGPGGEGADGGSIAGLVGSVGHAPLLDVAELEAARAWSTAAAEHLYRPAGGA